MRTGQSLSCFLLSIIYHHLFICLFLFTSIVNSSCLSAFVTDAFLHLDSPLQCHLLRHPHLRSLSLYICLCCHRLPLLSVCLLGAIYQDALSLCHSVAFLSSEPRGLFMDSVLSWTELWPWSYDRNLREPVRAKTEREN